MSKMTNMLFALVLAVLPGCADATVLVAQLPWDAGKAEYRVRVTESRNTDGVTVRALDFEDIKSKVVVHFETADAFVSGFSLRDSGGCFTTLWTSGSAYRVWVFRFGPDGVKPVLEFWTKDAPSIVANEACPTFNALQDGREVRYQWQGDKYLTEGR